MEYASKNNIFFYGGREMKHENIDPCLFDLVWQWCPQRFLREPNSLKNKVFFYRKVAHISCNLLSLIRISYLKLSTLHFECIESFEEPRIAAKYMIFKSLPIFNKFLQPSYLIFIHFQYKFLFDINKLYVEYSTFFSCAPSNLLFSLSYNSTKWT